MLNHLTVQPITMPNTYLSHMALFPVQPQQRRQQHCVHSSLTRCLLLQLLQVVVDHMLVCWEFLCTCYGCQYALSRVGECVPMRPHLDECVATLRNLSPQHAPAGLCWQLEAAAPLNAFSQH